MTLQIRGFSLAIITDVQLSNELFFKKFESREGSPWSMSALSSNVSEEKNDGAIRAVITAHSTHAYKVGKKL